MRYLHGQLSTLERQPLRHVACVPYSVSRIRSNTVVDDAVMDWMRNAHIWLDNVCRVCQMELSTCTYGHETRKAATDRASNTNWCSK